jgi:ATP-dependent exoDNAse (exonuclease V) beta subunit
MTPSVLEKDNELKFPHLFVLKASAGSGKTYELSRRFVQYLLSDHVPKNKLRNIVAMTFSNNAAKEMRERIILWLKLLAIGDEETVGRFTGLVSLDGDALQVSANRVLERIFDQYSDFQVKTIDSFMTAIFKASAVDFGYNPEFEILLDNKAMMEYAFHRYLRRVAEGTPDAAMLDSMIGRIGAQKKRGARYLWDPCEELNEEIRRLSRTIASRSQELDTNDASDDLKRLESRMRRLTEGLAEKICGSGLDIRRNSSYFLSDIPGLVREGRFFDLVGKKLATIPVNKLKKKDEGLAGAFEEVIGIWGDFTEMVHDYTVLYALSFFSPYITVYRAFERVVEDAKKTQGTIFIEDIGCCLASYLNMHIVPDIYFRLGETINHFFLDEFQDTSPIQWKNLYPLLENALSMQGSAFVVGDTKQAIYGFRDADYRIMKGVEKENPFPSAEYHVRELETNFRSCPEILAFNERVFKEGLAANKHFGEAASQSGLTDYIQHPNPDKTIKGHVELLCVEKSDTGLGEKERLIEIVSSLRERHYDYRDIAILTQRNDDAVRATTWLNEHSMPFISFSSLDIRQRKVTGELVALLKFLGSPTDDLSFADFLLGDIFARILGTHDRMPEQRDFNAFLFEARQLQQGPLYKIFQERYPDLWMKYFSGLFRASGYFPLYDLVTQAYHVFRLFEIYSHEEATLIKLLETVKDFEGRGFNSLGDFLCFATDEDEAEAEWHMNVPTTQDAIKVMTIHKAKGLGFRVAIVMLYESDLPSPSYVIREEGQQFSIMRINKEMAELDEELDHIYHEAQTRELVNRLNSLYVGFTRPKEELYIIGVAARTEQLKYPLSLLPFGDYRARSRPERRDTKKIDEQNELLLKHRHAEMVFPVAGHSAGSLKEKRRGDLIHTVLSFLQYLDGPPEAALDEAVRCAVSLTNSEPEEGIERDIRSFLEMQEIAHYFEPRPGRQVWNEKEFSDSAGHLYRIDRLVEDHDGITIIDYKTGSDSGAESGHPEQLQRYMRIIREIYPGRPVCGIIAYIDLKKIRRVS